jgi:hypothetical protein
VLLVGHSSGGAVISVAGADAPNVVDREIGQRRYLSHRTIATHLYRVFPKLGITARTELPAALAAEGAPAS